MFISCIRDLASVLSRSRARVQVRPFSLIRKKECLIIHPCSHFNLDVKGFADFCGGGGGGGLPRWWINYTNARPGAKKDFVAKSLEGGVTWIPSKKKKNLAKKPQNGWEGCLLEAVLILQAVVHMLLFSFILSIADGKSYNDSAPPHCPPHKKKKNLRQPCV